MNLVGILWQISFISVLIAFGVDVGLFTGLSKLNKKAFSSICVIYVISISYTLMSLSGHIEQFSKSLMNDITLYYMVIALILIIIGIIVIKLSVNVTSMLLLANLTLFFCTIVSVVINAVVIYKTIEISLMHLAIFSIILLLMSMIISYFSSNKTKKSNKEVSKVLGNYMLLFGEYIILSAIIMPKISYGLENSNGITINSAEYVIPVVIFMIILFAIGVVISRRTSLLK